MIASLLLDRLDGVRETGPDRWIAKCPAHEDASPSLSIRKTDDRLLIHDFAGCAVYDVLAAVGLELGDLFDPRIDTDNRSRPAVRPVPAKDILIALGTDLSFLAICAADVAKGEALAASDKKRLFQASGRFRSAVHVGGIR